MISAGPFRLRRRCAAVAAALVSTFAAAPAFSHPHVWVKARTELVFNGGMMESIRHVWQFDEAFTAFAIQGLDSDSDGTLTQEELQPLAKINVESLSEYDFFTYVGGGDLKASFRQPSEYWLDFNDGKLTLFYTLPLENPVGPTDGKLTVEVYDPTFFVDFAMVEEDPVLASGMPDNCALSFEKPKELDSSVAAALSEIPATQRDLPQEFLQITETLTNKATVACN